MMYGHFGKILEVDLTSGVIRRVDLPARIYEQVLSGKGLSVWYQLKHVPAGADPLGPDNILGLAAGTLTGTGALMTGRFVATAKSPLTGGWGESNCGGYFAPAIKQCGIDAIFIKGMANHPVYLYVDHAKAELRDASAYWGLDAVESEERLVQDSRLPGKKLPRVAVIGEAGERQSRISGIVHDGGRIAARLGLGAVMGSKNLKAVVLAGAKPVPCADPAKVKALSKELGTKLKKASFPSLIKNSYLGPAGSLLGKLPLNTPIDGMMTMPIFKKWGTLGVTNMSIMNGDGPILNWGGSHKDMPGAAKAFNADHLLRHEKHKYHCHSCALGCGGVFDARRATGDLYAQTHKPEYETVQAFGPLIKNQDLDSIILLNELLNRAGMDSISAGNTVAYALECFEKGLLSTTQTGGLQLFWGNMPDIITLVKQMITRQGFGAILADGVKAAAQVLGEATLPYAMHTGGQEPGMHDGRYDPQLAVHFVADPAPGKHTTGMGAMYRAMNLPDILTDAPPLKARKKKSDLMANQDIATESMLNACYTMLTDAAGGCYYGEFMGVHGWKLIEYLNAATGWNKSGDEYMEIGKRIQTLKQLFNIKHGIEPSTWKLPERMAGRPALKDGPLKGVTLDNENQVKLHWQAFGWDAETGHPLQETLIELGIPSLLEGDDHE